MKVEDEDMRVIPNIKSIREMNDEECAEFIKDIENSKACNDKEAAIKYIRDIRAIKNTSEVARMNNLSLDQLKRRIRKAAVAACYETVDKVGLDSEIHYWTNNSRFINAVYNCGIKTLKELTEFIRENGFNVPGLGKITLSEALADYEKATVESGRPGRIVDREINEIYYVCEHNNFVKKLVIVLPPFDDENGICVKASKKLVNIIPMTYSKKKNVWYNCNCVDMDTDCRIVLWCENTFKEKVKNKSTIMVSLKWNQSDVVKETGRVFHCKVSDYEFIKDTYDHEGKCLVVQWKRCITLR